jgi:hypothetical protein
LHHRAGNRDAADRQQFVEVKLQADAEHQQDDADLGELLRDPDVDRETRRIRADQRSGQQVTDDRRQAEALRDVAEEEGAAKPGRERQNQVVVVHGVGP